MLESFLMLAVKVASIYDEKNKTKYGDELLKYHKEIQDEELKQTPDDGRIGYLRLRIMRINKLLLEHAFESKNN